MAHETTMLLTALVAVASLIVLFRDGNQIQKQRRRFSLLDMLAVVTLIIASAGLIRGMANQERDGIPRFRLTEEIERHHAASAEGDE